MSSVFEIKGTPCTLCAHFSYRVHRFKYMCTRCVHAFSSIVIPLYKKKHMDKLPGSYASGVCAI